MSFVILLGFAYSGSLALIIKILQPLRNGEKVDLSRLLYPREYRLTLTFELLIINRLLFCLIGSNGLAWYKISNTLWIPDPRNNTAITWLRDAMVLKRFRWDFMTDELE